MLHHHTTTTTTFIVPVAVEDGSQKIDWEENKAMFLSQLKKKIRSTSFLGL